jgi:hypothetical protein
MIRRRPAPASTHISGVTRGPTLETAKTLATGSAVAAKYLIAQLPTLPPASDPLWCDDRTLFQQSTLSTCGRLS